MSFFKRKKWPKILKTIKFKNGATTFSIMTLSTKTFSIMALSIKGLFVLSAQMILSITMLCHNSECGVLI